MLTDGCDDCNGEEQRTGVRPEFRGVVVLAVPAVPLCSLVHLTTSRNTTLSTHRSRIDVRPTAAAPRRTPRRADSQLMTSQWKPTTTAIIQ